MSTRPGWWDPVYHGKSRLTPHADPLINALTNRINSQLQRVADRNGDLNALSGWEWKELASLCQQLDGARMASIKRIQAQRDSIIGWDMDVAGAIAADGLDLDLVSKILSYLAILLGAIEINKKRKEKEGE